MVIPIYNAEKTLGECLDSIIGQSYSELEIICVNDGSTDNSMDILKSYAEMDARIKVICQDNAGAGAARNAGIEASSYKFLTFVDADDVIDCSMYAKMTEIQNATSVDCVCCDALVIQADGRQGELRTIYDDNRIYHREEISGMIASLIGFSTVSTDGMCSLCNKLFVARIINLDYSRHSRESG